MEAIIKKYTATEILQIIQANYRQQAQYDIVVQKGSELTFETEIWEWIDICDLVPPDELWYYLDDYFRLKQDRSSWMSVLKDEKTLGDLCNFVAEHASHEIITSIKLLGSDCKTAAIFRTFTKRLKDKGIDTSAIRPSSKLEELVNQYGGVFIQEINLFAPTVLPPITYRANWNFNWGLYIFLLFGFLTCILWGNLSAWFTGLTAFWGFVMISIGANLKPKQASFQDIITIADLVRRINIAQDRN